MSYLGVDYCLPKAIAVGVSYINRDRDKDHWRAMSRSEKIQTAEAIRLQQQTTVKKIKDYELEEVREFQKLLTKV